VDDVFDELRDVFVGLGGDGNEAAELAVTCWMLGRFFRI
jgi:hypothetical protein